MYDMQGFFTGGRVPVEQDFWCLALLASAKDQVMTMAIMSVVSVLGFIHACMHHGHDGAARRYHDFDLQ